MKRFLLCALLLTAAALPAAAEPVRFSLAPVPYDLLVPEEIAPHLSAGPVTGGWAEEVKLAGGTAAALVSYQRETGDKVILFSAYSFPAAAWDAAQKPDQPPPFGPEVIRDRGMVLSTVGPFDVIFDPGTPDGRNVAAVAALLSRPESFLPAR